MLGCANTTPVYFLLSYIMQHQYSASDPKVINFDRFQTVFGVITIPENTWFVRGANVNKQTLGYWPLYFTFNREHAQDHADLHGDEGELLVYKTTRELRFYDLRYIKHLFAEALSTRQTPLTGSDLTAFKIACKRVMVSYGICSYSVQLQFIEQIYPGIEPERLVIMRQHMTKWRQGRSEPWVNPHEPQGVRVGESDNDMQSIQILKSVFGNQVDGYIAPRMPSPYHHFTGYINCECVVFDPTDAGMELVSSMDMDGPLPIISINHLYQSDYLFHKFLDIIPLHFRDRVHVASKYGDRRRSESR